MAIHGSASPATDPGLLHWGRPAQPDLFATGGDDDLLAMDALRERMTRFASGLSRVNDFSVAAWAGHAIGVEVGELSAVAVRELARVIVDYGAAAFVDSGAFGVFMRRIRGVACQPIDFHQVLARYDQLLNAIADYNIAEERIVPPLLVMPDVVDDQLASIELIREHRGWVGAACAFSGVCQPIIPIQRGPLSLAEAYRRLTEIVGSSNWSAGIPSNAAAISPDEFTAFLAEVQPKAVHILGALADSRVNPRLRQILDSGIADRLTITADANPLRSVIISRGQGASTRKALLTEKLGRQARQRELARILADLGGHEGVRARLAASGDDARRRLIGLIADFSDVPADIVAQRYGADLNDHLPEYRHAA